MMHSCTCRDVSMGSYAAQIVRRTPQGRMVGIDRCILPAIEELWALGIETIESCCGHGHVVGYIAVALRDEPRMEDLGYVRSEAAPHVFVWPCQVAIR